MSAPPYYMPSVPPPAAPHHPQIVVYQHHAGFMPPPPPPGGLRLNHALPAHAPIGTPTQPPITQQYRAKHASPMYNPPAWSASAQGTMSPPQPYPGQTVTYHQYLVHDSSPDVPDLVDNSPESLMVTMGTEGERIRDDLYRRFGLVIQEHGPLEATNEKILNIFIKLTAVERKIIMGQGSIKAFLGKSLFIRVHGNTLSLIGALPPEPESIKDDASTASSSGDSLPMVTGNSFDDTKQKLVAGDILKDHLTRRFVELLKHGPLEVTSQVVLNFFLKMSSAERRYIMSYGGIGEFLATSKLIYVDGKMLSLNSGSNLPQLTSDLAPGLFPVALKKDFSPSTSSTFLKVSSPEFIPQNMTTHPLGFAPSTHSPYNKDIAFPRADGDGLHHSSSVSSLDRVRGSSVDRVQGSPIRELRDLGVQHSASTHDKCLQTDALRDDTVPRRRFEQVVSRAQSAEERVIDLQTELCTQTLVKLRQDILENYIRIVKTPNRSESEKSSLQKDYSSVMRLIQDEVDRVQILHDSNLSALRDGLELKSLPDISFTHPTIPKTLAPTQQTTFGSGPVTGSSPYLSAPEPEPKPRVLNGSPLVGVHSARDRCISEASSVPSQESELSKRPPGLDNLQDLKVVKEGPDAGQPVVNGVASSISGTPESWNERPQSHASSETSSSDKLVHGPMDPKLAMLDPKLAQGMFDPKLAKGTIDPTLAQGMFDPKLAQGLMDPSKLGQPLGPMPVFPGFLQPGMSPEAMSQMLAMMQTVGGPRPDLLFPTAIPNVSGSLQEQIHRPAQSNSPPHPDKMDYFPQAHELDLKTVLPASAGNEEGQTTGLNNNVYKWPEPDNSPEQNQVPSPPRVRDRWEEAGGADARPKQGDEENSPRMNPSPAISQSQPSATPPAPLNIQQVTKWMPASEEASPGAGTTPPPPAAPSPEPSMAAGGKKPLPILQSSIPTVAVNVVQPGPPRGYSVAAEPPRPEPPKPEPAPCDLNFPPLPSAGAPQWVVPGVSQHPSVRAPPRPAAVALAAEMDPEEAAVQKNVEVAATNPLLTSKLPVLPNDGAVSDLSEISIQDDMGGWETGWESVIAKENNAWQQVSKKAKGKAMDEYDTISTSSNFEKLLQKIREMYPKMSRQDVTSVVDEVRERRGGLKGVSMAQILQDTANIVRSQKGKEEESVTNILYKTSICAYWQNGKCTKTSKECIYAHGKKDLKPMPKTSMCNNMVNKGSCPYGDKCVFAHSKEQMKRS